MKKRTKLILIIIASILLLAGLALLLFPPVSNYIGKQKARHKTEDYEKTLTYVISEDSDAGTGITQKTYADALKAGEVDSEGYALDKESGKRTSSAPVLFKADLDRLRRDSIAYNEDLKKTQGSKFNGSGDFNGKSALDLRDYGIYDGVYGYVSAPSIDMLLPIYLGRIFFDNLRSLNIGDRITVRNFWETLTYEVSEKNTFKPNESAAAFIKEGEDLFTMFTCTPSASGDFDRFFVKCRRVGG